jgi:hypothetical protein
MKISTIAAAALAIVPATAETYLKESFDDVSEVTPML